MYQRYFYLVRDYQHAIDASCVEARQQVGSPTQCTAVRQERAADGAWQASFQQTFCLYIYIIHRIYFITFRFQNIEKETETHGHIVNDNLRCRAGSIINSHNISPLKQLNEKKKCHNKCSVIKGYEKRQNNFILFGLNDRRKILVRYIHFVVVGYSRFPVAEPKPKRPNVYLMADDILPQCGRSESHQI